MSSTSDAIVKDPEILGGTPVFRGTRVPFKKLANFNLETLVIYAEALGMNPQIKINKRPAEMATAR